MPKKRRWRYSKSTGYWYWECDKWGHGQVWPTVDGDFGASTARAFAVFRLVRDAKRFVERNAS